MTVLIQCQNLFHSVGSKNLFQDLNLILNTGDKVGLVGHNGSGKSTLLSILSGEEIADKCDLSRNTSLHLEFVEQFISPNLLEKSLFQSVVDKLPETDRETDQYRVELILASLGFTEPQFQYIVKDLSGGQQNRLMFARAIINQPNLILFDEPTNHLDLTTLLVFENYLLNINAAFMIISHDRKFLDSVTTRTLYLRDKKLYNFDMPYSAAKIALEEQDQAALAMRESEEKNIKRLESSAKRIATWSRAHESEKLARKAKSMEKRVVRLKQDRTFVTRGSGLNLSVDLSSTRAKRMLQIEDHLVRAPDNPSTLFSIKTLTIRPGERVSLLGHNGTGKTTFINQIMQRWSAEKTDEKIKFSPQCKIGYYDQELEFLNPNQDMMQVLRNQCGGLDNNLKSALIKAGFPYQEMDKKVGIMSGGEKARLMFLIIKLNRPNFLILDEPTNHIDIQGKEELEQQILESNATVLITSHDRHFVDVIADRHLVIQSGRLEEIHDLEGFYSSESLRPLAVNSNQDKPERNQAEDIEEDVLVQIIFLEKLLADDLARKPKFQKQKKQLDWKSKIDSLYKLL